MEGYFSNISDAKKAEARVVFMEALEREQFACGEFLCRQHESGDKLYVLEEGTINFVVHGQLAGEATNGSVFGELSLIYGVPRQADILATTPIICWSMDTLAFRRVQAIIARDSLNTSKSKIMTKFGKQASALAEEQEVAVKDDNKIKFADLQMLSVVGQGTFGAVYIASCKREPDVACELLPPPPPVTPPPLPPHARSHMRAIY
jgi:CRP-like cAMP-binding protein